MAIGSDTFSFTATNTSMDTVATNLKSSIDAHANYAAKVSGSVITVTDGAGTAAITVSAGSWLPADGTSVGSTTEAGRTVNLSGLSVVVGRGYRVSIGSDVYTYTAQSGNSLQDIATQLKTAISAKYAATLRSSTLGQDWTAVLNELDWQIEAGEAITGTPAAASYKLSLQANVANTPFTVDAVGVTSASAVTNNGTTPTVMAASGVAQQNIIDFGSFTLQTGDAFTVVLDGKPIVVSTATKEVDAQVTTVTPAASDKAQVTRLTYFTLGSGYAYTAIIGQNYYEARVGSVVNGSTVEATWESILEALRFQIAAGESTLTVTAEADNKRLVLTANENNKPFDVRGRKFAITSCAKPGRNF